MKIRKVAGWSLLSTIPLGMLTTAIFTGSVLEFLFAIGVAALFMGVLFGSFWLIDGGR
ncbi:hypothetical protein [Streptomyces globisporus]|uniref:hypothetical protein n=1 Tax=Streptomyces globisporus TaxID=1908 RepID=UPI00367F22AB